MRVIDLLGRSSHHTAGKPLENLISDDMVQVQLYAIMVTPLQDSILLKLALVGIVDVIVVQL